MKHLYKKLGLLSLAIICFTACEKSGDEFTASNQGDSILLEADISTIDLDDTNPSNPAVTLTWSDANYGVQTAINYTVEVSADQSFSAPYVAGNSTDTAFSWTTSQLNASASNAGLDPFEFASLYVRIKSSVGSQNSLPSFSNVIMLMVKPYYNYPYVDLYFVGPASASGWENNNSNAALFRSATEDNIYTYTGYFNADQLKMLEMRGAWAPQYGGTGGSLVYRPTEAADDPSPIADITSSGYYTFTANLSNLTYSVEPFDVGSSPTLNSVGIVGSATPSGGSETALQKYGIGGNVFDPHIWYSMNIHLVPGELQFVANNTDTWGSDTQFSGQTTPNGGTITVIVEDDYEVWFNDLTGDYILIPLNL
ncbi:SusE domain-containing protein [Subsaxibacter sp. CAU 1640]|uniref:SusE domain-containing protein n=1 Tax=Subsaxibacter sp. CAU 1640 TaxID=2933271 RepID=UPI002002D29A|nr:SusE domain-containing protein [Subsaxibacter sp. CAU 1640]MCK7589056.1 SusE domain-containing protein [Subsaxibacter sp. CAU 1640]